MATSISRLRGRSDYDSATLVSGQATTIEQLISGVVVRFDGVDGPRGGRDLGVWDSPDRHIPLFP